MARYRKRVFRKSLKKGGMDLYKSVVMTGGNSRRPAVLKHVPNRVLQSNFGARLNGPVGQQTIISLPVLSLSAPVTFEPPVGFNTYAAGQSQNSDIANMMSTYQQTDFVSNVPDLFKMMKVYVESATMNMRYTNNSTAMVQLEIYDLVCRRNTNLQPEKAWDDGIQDVLTLADPNPLIDNNNTTTYSTQNPPGNSISIPVGNPVVPPDTVARNASPLASQFLGARPTQSRTFNLFYKVLKKKVIWLQPGQVHEHILHINHKKFIHATELTAGVSALAGVTRHCMMVASGFPVRVVSVEGSPQPIATNQTTSGSKCIDWNMTKTIRFKTIEPRASSLYSYNSLRPTIGALNVPNTVSQEANVKPVQTAPDLVIRVP